MIQKPGSSMGPDGERGRTTKHPGTRLKERGEEELHARDGEGELT